MKKSEELRLASQQEDNDIKSFALLCQVLRESRSEKFIEDYLPVLIKRYPVEARTNGSYSITTQDHGIIDYFPKANKLLIRKDNNWIKPGLKWIINNLLN
jgi:hypothetical protein